MKRIILEGTEEQMINFKLLMAQGDNDLPKIKEDYQTANLWTVGDVTGNYNCNDEDAMIVLEEAMENEATMNQIWESIEAAADNNNIVRNGTPELNH